MKTVPTKPRKSNPDMKRSVILFPRPAPKQLERGQFHTYKLRTTPADATFPLYELSVPVFDCRTPEEWIKFRRGLTATLLKGDMLTVFKQAEIARGNQSVPHFKLCLDDIAKHIFPEKAGQIQKRYMQRKIHWSKDYTVKEWVAW
eukprot:7809473-Ditylum_brightwellii.AAC.1